MEEQSARKSRIGAAAFGFAVAGAAACWNPLAAPFGLFLGAGSAFLAVRALGRRSGNRRAVQAALALGILDCLASVLVLLLSTGLFTAGVQSEQIVTRRSASEVKALLDDAAAKTAPARERASRELDQFGPLPADKAPSAPARRTSRGK